MSLMGKTGEIVENTIYILNIYGKGPIEKQELSPRKFHFQPSKQNALLDPRAAVTIESIAASFNNIEFGDFSFPRAE